MTHDEHARLLGIHGQKMLDAGIELLDAYCESKGKTYRSYYAVLKSGSWVWTRLREQDKAMGTALTKKQNWRTTPGVPIPPMEERSAHDPA